MTPMITLSSLLDTMAPDSLAGWLARMTLIAALACVYLSLARNARPAVRHAVAVAGLLAVTLLPVASALLPVWSIPVLPAVSASNDRPLHDMSRGSAPAIDAASLDMMAARLADPVDPAADAPAPTAREAALLPRIDMGSLALSIWGLVALALLARAGLGLLRAHRLGREARPIDDPRLFLESDRAARVLGLSFGADVAVSPDLAIPVVVGVRRPRVVLPVSAIRWSRERLAVVFLHELSHVRRQDAVWMLVARCVTALLWFHPLVWVLSRHVRRESERACDDAVLAYGVRGSEYAEHLLAIARLALARDPLRGATLAFASLSSLEGRVASILTVRPRSGAMSRRALASLAGASVILVAVAAVMRPAPVESARVLPYETPLYAAGTNAGSHEQHADAHAAHAADGKYKIKHKTSHNKYEYQYRVAGNGDDAGEASYDEASELYQRRSWERAAQAYAKAAKLGYRPGTAYYNAGCSWALAGRTDDAIESLRAAFEEGFDRPDLFAEDEDLNSLRGDARFKKLLDEVMNTDEAQQRRRAATKDFERLAKEKDVEDGEWNSVGIDLLRSGDYEGAGKAFDNEFKVSGDEDALYNLACARALAGNADAALKLLEQAITTGSVNADHMSEDADLASLHGKDRFDELLDLAEDLELHGGNVWRFWDNDDHKGDDAKRWEKSLPRFERVAKEHPQIGRAWFNLGYAQLMSGDARTSTASFTKALELGYQKPTTMYNLACAAAQSGDIDGAFGWLERAEGAGFESWERARWDEDLEPLRGDPRYKEFRKRWREEERAGRD